MNEAGKIELSKSNLLGKNDSQHSDGLIGHVNDFFRGAAYASIQAPVDGITQFVNHVWPVELPHMQIVAAPSSDSIYSNAGKLAGAVVDFALLQKGLGKAAPDFFGAQAASPTWLKMGATGAAFQSLMPTSENGNYFLNKGRDIGISFGTFAAIGAVAEYMAPKMGNTFLGRVGAGAEGGFTGGLTQVALTDTLYLQKPGLNDLQTIGKYTAFGAALGAVDYMQERLQNKLHELRLQQSIQANQDIFKDAADSVQTATKQLYDVKFRKVTNPAGERVPTLENPAGEAVKSGDWIAQRLDANGKVVVENGRLNQWPIKEGKIPKTYNVTPEAMAGKTEFIAPTRIDGPPVHMVKLDEPIKILTPWGSMTGNPGDWLANYDYNPNLKLPGTDFAIITYTSFKQTYQFKPTA